MGQKLKTSKSERINMKLNAAQDNGRTFEDSEWMRDYQLFKKASVSQNCSVITNGLQIIQG
jgi:hypothetical protein